MCRLVRLAVDETNSNLGGLDSEKGEMELGKIFLRPGVVSRCPVSSKVHEESGFEKMK